MAEWESWERDLRLLRLENTPEGRVVSWLLKRDGRTNGDENEEGKEREMEWERSQVFKTFKNTWRKGGETVWIKDNRRVMWMFVRMEWRNEEGRKTVLVREDTRRKCGQTVVAEIECEMGAGSCIFVCQPFSVIIWRFLVMDAIRFIGSVVLDLTWGE